MGALMPRYLLLLLLCTAHCGYVFGRTLLQGKSDKDTTSKALNCAARVHPSCTACYTSKDAEGGFTLLCRTCVDGMRVSENLLGCGKLGGMM